LKFRGEKKEKKKKGEERKMKKEKKKKSEEKKGENKNGSGCACWQGHVLLASPSVLEHCTGEY